MTTPRTATRASSPLRPALRIVRPPRERVAALAERLICRFGAQLAPRAVCLSTAVPQRVPFSSIKLPGPLAEFLRKYEPRVEVQGAWPHQARVLEVLGKQCPRGLVLTSSTGSGKSLAIWAWIMDTLTREHSASSIATFPTQALLWGQAERLARISTELTLIDDQPFAGVICLGNVRVPWSVWYGTQQCDRMRAHERSEAFLRARLRLTTLDKVHWSLMRSNNARFLRTLRAVAIDEAHTWHGIQGANARALLDRICLSLELHGAPPPRFFLASATLPSARAFAEDLTGVPADRFLEVSDERDPQVSPVPLAELPYRIRQHSAATLQRFVLLARPGDCTPQVADVLGDAKVIGDASALHFASSKFVAHRRRSMLAQRIPERDAIAYDADLPANRRREVERALFAGGATGVTIVATSALELGIDLRDLDFVVMDDLPPRRADLMQRLGRVGRSPDHPGLAMLLLGDSPSDCWASKAPLEFFRREKAATLPLPIHLDIVRHRAAAATVAETRHLLRNPGDMSKLRRAMIARFGIEGSIEQLAEQAQRRLGSAIDVDDANWCYQGFRASASQGKRRLVLAATGEEVAVIDDLCLFRDAHPEAVYLGHDGRRSRIVGYEGPFKLGRWSHPDSPVELGKWMKTIHTVVVEPETRQVATRGRWRDRCELEERLELERGHDRPASGELVAGRYSFIRKFDGYLELDLAGRRKARNVSLAEVSERFKTALEAGERFPFLHDFAYATLGWKWESGTAALSSPCSEAVLARLHPSMCMLLECAEGDINVSLANGALTVTDATPGGNGLSEALLAGNRFSDALRAALEEARTQFGMKRAPGNAAPPTQEVIDALADLSRAWGR